MTDDELIEAIREAMHGADPDLLPCEQSRAAAVLPIIREAQAEALRETADWWAANPDDDAFETPGDTRNWMRDTAAEYEQETP